MTNPLLEPWHLPFGAPPFDAIEPAHFEPAFDAALAEHEAEVAAIAGDPAAPTFANTIVALERAGASLARVGGVFWNLSAAHTNDALQAIERTMSPRLSRHYSAISMNAALFARVDALHARSDALGLDAEAARVLHLTHEGFVRSGARLGEADKTRLATILERLAVLGTGFSQNVLADEKAFELPLEDEAALAGLPATLRAACAAAARERGREGHVVTLSRSLIEPFLQFSDRRDLREAAYAAWTRRGDNGGPTDTWGIVAETLRLRRERATLLGFDTFAAYKLDDAMARTPEAVRDLLMEVWRPALARATRERDALATFARDAGEGAPIARHDWRYWAEKLRKARHDLDDAAIKPYLALDNVVAAAFDTATRLFGLTFEERHDVPTYHPDVRVWTVADRNGRALALFVGDYLARPSKRSGAWMSAFRGQNALATDDGAHARRPIVVNVMNFAKGAEGRPTLLSFDDARTLFHEFGHGLHGMMSDVGYPSIAGTSVPRDFVEFPSQLYEHWFMRPEVLTRFALHVDTGEPMPAPLLARVLAARNFNQGFSTVEYCASALVDLDFHTGTSDVDPATLERETLARIGMPPEIGMRHRTPHFAHVFSGDGYSAGYYSYLWSEVLDADGFAAFEETGDVFDAATARRLADFVYSAGSKRAPREAYHLFRGREPHVRTLLAKRGLDETVSDAA